MISINKEEVAVPEKLNSKITIKRRDEIIEAEEFLKDIKGTVQKKGIRYSARYRDVKNNLKKLYNNKCCYCENKIELGEVEHFRPKEKYYWLAYSWDNLLYSCKQCNVNKSNKFELAEKGKQVTYNIKDLEHIHNLANEYSKTEKNLFIHPEIDNVVDYFLFSQKGKIKAKNTRAEYTITELKLNREYLVTYRKKILDDYKKDISRRYFEFRANKKTKEELISSIKDRTNDFRKTKDDVKNDFLAFRQNCIKENYIIQTI